MGVVDADSVKAGFTAEKIETSLRCARELAWFWYDLSVLTQSITVLQSASRFSWK
jgi:hypothetical protein